METVGRFAPSPSGRMHLGNLLCALLSWLSAKSAGGRLILRIEDPDGADRNTPGSWRRISAGWDCLGMRAAAPVGHVPPMTRAAARSCTNRRSRHWSGRERSIHASAPGLSFMPPAPPTGRTA